MINSVNGIRQLKYSPENWHGKTYIQILSGLNKLVAEQMEISERIKRLQIRNNLL